MTDWDLRRARIDWDWGANGLWFDNCAYARQQRLLPDGSIAGPPKKELNSASSHHEALLMGSLTVRIVTVLAFSRGTHHILVPPKSADCCGECEQAVHSRD
jgi:hypothetical protein